MKTVLPALCLLVACAHTSESVEPTAGPARTEDVATIDGIMKAYYEVVNIEPGGPTQWDRDRALYSPWIHFVSFGPSRDGQAHPDIMTHPELAKQTEPLIAKGFRENEIFRKMHLYGNIAHVESTYETFVGKENPRKSRGVNYLELYYDGTRWWVASAVWQSEDAQHPIPADLLP